jgi:hypothetical protein
MGSTEMEAWKRETYHQLENVQCSFGKSQRSSAWCAGFVIVTPLLVVRPDSECRRFPKGKQGKKRSSLAFVGVWGIYRTDGGVFQRCVRRGAIQPPSPSIWCLHIRRIRPVCWASPGGLFERPDKGRPRAPGPAQHPRVASVPRLGPSRWPGPVAAKNLSHWHLGRWDGIFSRPTFFEAGGTDFSEAISRQILRT